MGGNGEAIKKWQICKRNNAFPWQMSYIGCLILRNIRKLRLSDRVDGTSEMVVGKQIYLKW